MFNVGDRIGDFTIVARLKAGGMATLFLGERSGAAGFAKHVAIKIVHAHLADDSQFVRMFVDEALLSARIQHPNVVHVEELGEAEGTYFLVMEFVHGCSLANLIRALARRKRRFAPELAVAIAIQLADGLHAAHETRGPNGEMLGVVHRDVSPQNVLLAYAGHVKLIDFGIAKAEGRSQSTAAGSIKGKFRYMSPEQAMGKAVDRRSDIYSLGIVLWEMLTGRSCFDAQNDLLVLDKVRNPQVEPPSTYTPGIPPALDAAVMSVLAPDPDKRPRTAKEMRRRLGEAFPAALSVDAAQISDLLLAVMTEHIDRERNELPHTVVVALDRQLAALGHAADAPDPSAKSAKDGEELLLTMTLSADDILTEAEPGDDARDISPPAVARSVKVERAGGKRSSALPWALVAAALVAGGAVAAYVIGAGSSPEPAATAPAPASPANPSPSATPDAGPGPSADAGSTAVAEAAPDTGPTTTAEPTAPTKRRRTKRPPGTGDRGGGPLLVDDVF